MCTKPHFMFFLKAVSAAKVRQKASSAAKGMHLFSVDIAQQTVKRFQKDQEKMVQNRSKTNSSAVRLSILVLLKICLLSFERLFFRCNIPYFNSDKYGCIVIPVITFVRQERLLYLLLWLSAFLS